MNRIGTESTPLRVAVIGAGPAGFYAVQRLFQAENVAVRVDVLDRLPTPFGLVRHGVAPDHQKIKSVTAVYDRLAADPRCRFLGNVAYGKDISLEDLGAHYHQVVFCTGAESDRRMGIPGEDLAGSHPATEFVAWYNGHPDYAHSEFDLDVETAVVVGVGNVAVDVARILCRSIAELERTDIADHALAALKRSRIRNVYLLGRRGPAQAAFTNPEIKELGELAEATVSTRTDEVEPDPLSQAFVEAQGGRATLRKMDILRAYAGREDPEKPKRLIIRFLTSPVELLGDPEGRVASVRLVRNELQADESGALRPRSTGRHETLPTGLVFRSVGYRGVPLPDLPFHDAWGLVPNEKGRVVDGDSGTIPGVYVAGWIKRGPSGIIGTNKPDAAETVVSMLDDLERGVHLAPTELEPESVDRLLEKRGTRVVTYEDWKRLDAIEVARGAAIGRPRVKFTDRENLLEALAGTTP